MALNLGATDRVIVAASFLKRLPPESEVGAMAGSAGMRGSLGRIIVMVATMVLAAAGAAAQTTRPRMVDVSKDFKSKNGGGRIVFERDDRIFHGRVWDSTFRPLDAAVIEVYLRRDVVGFPAAGGDGDPFAPPKPVARTVSASDGSFHFELEVSEEYVAFAKKDDGHFGEQRFRPIPKITKIEIFAQFARAIERTLVDPDRKPVEDAEVVLGQRAFEASAADGIVFLTRASRTRDGRLRVPVYLGTSPRRFGPQDFFVSVVDTTLYWRRSAAGSAFFASGDDLSSRRSLVLPRSRPVDLEILGSDLAAGTPVEFTIFCKTTPADDAAPITQYRRIKTKIGATVRWEEAPVDGLVEVVLSSNGISWVSDGAAGSKLPGVSENGAVAAMKINFDRGVAISGRLLDRGALTPVAGVSVRLLPIVENGDDDVIRQHVVRTGDDGAFEFENLPRMKFGLAVDSMDWVPTEARRSGSGAEASESRPVDKEPMLSFVRIDAAPSIDAVDILVERSATVAGRVVDRLGRGVRGLEVVIGRADGVRASEKYWPGVARSMSRRWTDQDGSFKFVGVSAAEACEIIVLAADRRPQVVEVSRGGAGESIDLGSIVLAEPTPPARVKFLEGDVPLSSLDVVLMSGDLPKATDPRMKTDERGEIAFVDRFGAATRAVAMLDRPAGLRFEGGRFDIPVRPKSGETEVIRMVRFPVISGSIARGNASEEQAKFVTAVWLDEKSSIDAPFEFLPSEDEAQRLERVRLSSKEVIRSDGTFTIEVPREGRYYLDFSSAPIPVSDEDLHRGGPLLSRVAPCFLSNAPVVKTGTSPAAHTLKSIGARLPLVALLTAPAADRALLAREFPSFLPAEGRR